MKLREVLGDTVLVLNQKNFSSLRGKAESGKITWVLGAGISVPAGLPQWEELLSKMWAKLSEIGQGTHFDDENEMFIKACNDKLDRIQDVARYRTKVNNAYAGKSNKIFSGINVLESAEYMWNYIDDLILDVESKEKLRERVLKSLMRSSLSIDASKDELKMKLSGQAVSILAQKLASRKKGTVITYNYDDVLEFCLQETGELSDTEVKVICDCDEDKTEDAGKINIHHPHGALKVVGSELGKESDHIILTESSYYQMEQAVYRWENSVQAKALVETNCIFVGFSGEDYNFRRIIKNIGFQPKGARPRHYIFFCIDDLVKSVYGEEVERRYEEMCKGNAAIRGCSTDEQRRLKDSIRKNIVNEDSFIYEGIQLINMLYARYSYWKRHGIVPIWSTFEELPEMVKEIQQ